MAFNGQFVNPAYPRCCLPSQYPFMCYLQKHSWLESGKFSSIMAPMNRSAGKGRWEAVGFTSPPLPLPYLSLFTSAEAVRSGSFAIKHTRIDPAIRLNLLQFSNERTDHSNGRVNHSPQSEWQKHLATLLIA